MIERVLAQLARHGISHAVLSLGYRPDAFTTAYPGAMAAGVSLEYAVEPEPLDTAGAIAFAARHAGIDETFVVVNGDVLTDLDLSVLMDFHQDRGGEATVALTPVEDPSRYGVLDLEHDGKVRAFVEKPEREEAPSNLANAGTYVLEPSVLDEIAPMARCSVEREVFPSLAARGTLFALASDAYWLDAGTPEAYLRAHADLMQGVRGTPPSPGALLIREGVWASGEAEIMGEVSGGSFLGSGCAVGKGARVVGSCIGRGAVVEAGASVISSVLFADARIGEGTIFEDSIAGFGARVGASSHVHETSILGDHSETPPGSRLAGARVGPGKKHG